MTELNQGKRLQALIEQHGYTLTSLAPMIGYVRETLSRKLQADDVDRALILKISDAIGVDLVPVMYPGEDHERDAECDTEISRLRRELEQARQTIRDLSAAIRAMSEKQ